jgi:hypothetical protein
MCPVSDVMVSTLQLLGSGVRRSRRQQSRAQKDGRVQHVRGRGGDGSQSTHPIHDQVLPNTSSSTEVHVLI